jgi:Tfp pilus assembly pilus retraction ATPase PilT
VKIGTYEEPIEFVFPRVPVIGGEQGSTSVTMPEVSQVQIGHHLKEFHLAAPNALRRKFDVLVMGEMRDKGSVDTGLLLASTGHATYATLHCETPAEAIGRILSEFPYDAQPSVANKLLSNLRVIVAQKIERNMAGKGVAFRSWCIFDQAFKADLYEMPHQQWGRKIEKRMQANGSTFAQQAYGPLMRGEISESAFANIAGFNPVEAREYLANCRTQEALDREGVEHEGRMDAGRIEPALFVVPDTGICIFDGAALGDARSCMDVRPCLDCDWLADLSAHAWAKSPLGDQPF